MFLRQKKSKYGAQRTNGFPSKLEAAVYGILHLREKAGEIRDITQQHTVVLQDGPSNERIAWKVDFAFIDVKSGETMLAEAKGVETEGYTYKLKLYRRHGKFPLEIWKGSYARPVLTEVVIPKILHTTKKGE